jgi:hypothetical protein
MFCDENNDAILRFKWVLKRHAQALLMHIFFNRGYAMFKAVIDYRVTLLR